MDDVVPVRKKPVAFLPSFANRSIIRGEGLFRFSAQVVVLLVVALMVLALLAAMGIETPASDGLAIFFGLVIWVWLMGFLAWFLFGSLVRKLCGPNQLPPESESVEDTIEDTLLSPDTVNSPSIQGESDREMQLDPESRAGEESIFAPRQIDRLAPLDKSKLDVESEDTEA